VYTNGGELDGLCNRHGREEECIETFVIKSERKRQVRRLEDNIKTDFHFNTKTDYSTSCTRLFNS
jgi:hypothetical protein